MASRRLRRRSGRCSRRNGAAARQFFKRLLRRHGGESRTIVTDKLGSYKVAQRELMPTAHYNTAKYANNRAEQSHELTRLRERGMGRFKSPSQPQSLEGGFTKSLTLTC
ncbi:DDE-type integrase/transposase/recombinase [Paraperlucidibaca wandonensis]|uniref:DDE-type integrase/transposase/recombinase n=1 Tax=Paraperlucidibaca wandonensis TaxID=1268273 RepID=A0ABW3HDW9_9GAMM